MWNFKLNTLVYASGFFSCYVVYVSRYIVLFLFRDAQLFIYYPAHMIFMFVIRIRVLTLKIFTIFIREKIHVLLLLITIVTIKTTILVRCKMAEACTSASFFIFKHTIKILPTNQTSKSFPVHFILRTNTYLSIWYLLSHMFGSLWKMITRAGSIESRLPTTKCFIWWSYYINFDIQYCNLPCPSLSTSVTFSHMWRGFPLFYKYFYGNFFWFAYLFGVSISWI